LIVGYADSTFGGSRRITRAKMAVIRQRVILKGLMSVNFAAEVDFADARAFPAWATDGIRTADTAGLVCGFSDRIFLNGKCDYQGGNGNHAVSAGSGKVTIKLAFKFSEGCAFYHLILA